MKHTLALLTALLLAQMAALHAAEEDQAERLPSSECNLRLEAPVDKCRPRGHQRGHPAMP